MSHGNFSPTIKMTSTVEKLEDCEVCGKSKAKYTCPKCEVRTCCLTCSKIHKKELECDGVRDKTKYLPIKAITDLHLMSDYCFLQEIGRSVDKYNRDRLKRCTTLNNFLPIHLRRLKSAAFRRGVNLEFMPRSFSRNKQNTTRLIWKKNELLWRIEWIFPEAESIKWITERASEKARLSVLLENVLEPEMKAGEDPNVLNLKSILRDKLQFYRSAGLSGIKVLMKAEKVEKSDCRYYELDPTLTLAENLEHKSIIEYPTVYIILSHNSDMYEIIESDDEGEKDQQRNPLHSFKFKTNRKFGNFASKSGFTRNENGIHIPDEKNESKPINFLFHTEFSDSEDESLKVKKEEKIKQVNKYRRRRNHERNENVVHVQRKIQKIRDNVCEFTGMCKSDSEDESKKNMQEMKAKLEIVKRTGSTNGKSDEVQKPATNHFIDSHITDSEDEGPEEVKIQRLWFDKCENENENKKSENTDKNVNNCEEKDERTIRQIAINYFGAYMSDSEENISEDTGNSELHIPLYQDLVKMNN